MSDDNFLGCLIVGFIIVACLPLFLWLLINYTIYSFYESHIINPKNVKALIIIQIVINILMIVAGIFIERS